MWVEEGEGMSMGGGSGFMGRGERVYVDGRERVCSCEEREVDALACQLRYIHT